jgi:hypothetical protein
MSDLAPFVAAALRDGTTVDVLQEIEKLRAKLRKTRMVSVTGPRGSPVYASGHIVEDGFSSDRPAHQNMWTVEIGENSIPCPIENVRSIELRIGDVVYAKFGKYGTYDGTILTYEYESRVDILDEDDEFNMSFRFNPLNRDADIKLNFGELSEQDYNYITGYAMQGFSVDPVATGKNMLNILESLPSNTSLREVEFQSVLLPYDSIRDLIEEEDS